MKQVIITNYLDNQLIIRVVFPANMTENAVFILWEFHWIRKSKVDHKCNSQYRWFSLFQLFVRNTEMFWKHFVAHRSSKFPVQTHDIEAYNRPACPPINATSGESENEDLKFVWSHKVRLLIPSEQLCQRLVHKHKLHIPPQRHQKWTHEALYILNTFQITGWSSGPNRLNCTGDRLLEVIS